MANADLQVNLDQLHADILAGIVAQFPDVKTVEFYRDDEDEQIPTPAILLNMEECPPSMDDDNGSDQLPLKMRFQADVIIPNLGSASMVSVRKLATALATWLFQTRRFKPCDPLELIACEPNHFNPSAEKWCVWKVEWHMLGYFGAAEWNNDDGTGVDGAPGIPMFSWNPKIGTGNEPNYEPVIP